eukprot:4600910-Amphidinium_carterae.1
MSAINSNITKSLRDDNQRSDNGFKGIAMQPSLARMCEFRNYSKHPTFQSKIVNISVVIKSSLWCNHT